MEELLTTDSLISLLTLTVLEIVLGIDNIVFISIVAGKLPYHLQDRARRIGLFFALGARVLLLMSISYIVSLKSDIFTIMDMGFSGRDLILLGGGIFLIYKTIKEILEKFDAADDTEGEKVTKGKQQTFAGTIVQIIIIDIVFSFDSILTAVGLSRQLPIMIAAVVISMAIMFFFSGVVARFIDRNPTIKMLALAFLIMIGVLLIVESFDVHVDKAYIYVAMTFSLLVELLNMKMRNAEAKANKQMDLSREEL